MVTFPSDWNTALIISMPKKGVLTDCNNYCSILLIIIGLKTIAPKNNPNKKIFLKKKILDNKLSKFKLIYIYIYKRYQKFY